MARLEDLSPKPTDSVRNSDLCRATECISVRITMGTRMQLSGPVSSMTMR